MSHISIQMDDDSELEAFSHSELNGERIFLSLFHFFVLFMLVSLALTVLVNN